MQNERNANATHTNVARVETFGERYMALAHRVDAIAREIQAHAV